MKQHEIYDTKSKQLKSAKVKKDFISPGIYGLYRGIIREKLDKILGIKW